MPTELGVGDVAFKDDALQVLKGVKGRIAAKAELDPTQVQRLHLEWEAPCVERWDELLAPAHVRSLIDLTQLECSFEEGRAARAGRPWVWFDEDES